MADILVTYFSRSGTAEKVARDLAGRLGADLMPIRPMTSYAGPFGFAKGLWQTLTGAEPRVERIENLDRYALVVIGSPVWAGRLPAPVRAFLNQQFGRIGRTAAFCVSGSGGSYEAVFREIKQVSGRAPLATLSLKQSDAMQGAADDRLRQFAEGLRVTLPQAA